jgi:hypothetical protein
MAVFMVRFKESTGLRGKVNITSLIFESSNFITMAMDISSRWYWKQKERTV